MNVRIFNRIYSGKSEFDNPLFSKSNRKDSVTLTIVTTWSPGVTNDYYQNLGLFTNDLALRLIAQIR